MIRTTIAAIAAAAILIPASAHALSHFASIREVVSGLSGNPDIQYVELSTQTAGQGNFKDTRLTAFNTDGSVVTVLLVTPSNLPLQVVFPKKALYATPDYATATGITPNYFFAPGIPTPSGQICWGSPTAGFPPPPGTWDATDPNNYVDCVAYGSYTGPTRTAAVTGGTSGTPSSLPPGDGTLALTRIAGHADDVTGNNATDFALRDPGPCNNAASNCDDFGCVNTAGTCAVFGGDGCSNGNVDPPEECDDGNLTDGDGCDNDCTISAVPPSAKTELGCQRTVNKETAKFLQAKAKILCKCELAKVKGKLAPGTNCKLDDPKTVEKLAKIEAKKIAGIGKKCGGTDKVCDGNRDEEVTPATLGFGSVCPGFEGLGKCTGGTNDGTICGADSDCTGGGVCVKCDGAIDQKICTDVTVCVDCIAAVATHQMNELLSQNVVSTDPKLQKDENKCQQTILKSTWKFYGAKSKILQKCWEKRLLGKHADACPDATAADGTEAKKAADKIAKIEAKMIAGICKKCGGPDKACGGGDDLSLGTLYAPAPTCPAVTLPGPPFTMCGSIVVSSVTTLVDCLACVAEFKIDCVSAALVPSIAPYPAECN